MNTLIRRSDDRGAVDFGWLKSKHTFSFGRYYDPAFMGFGSLRVINEDNVAPGGGFPTHPHDNMEIISYVVDGGLEHKDSIGTGSVIKPGDIQRMRAGTGIQHSEFNHSKDDPVHFLQIWLLPSEQGLKPGYEQKAFSNEEKLNQLKLVASPDGRDGSITVHSDADLYASILEAGKSVAHTLEDGHGAWLQLVKGQISVNEDSLSKGDGIALKGSGNITITATEDAEFLLFDLSKA